MCKSGEGAVFLLLVRSCFEVDDSSEVCAKFFELEDAGRTCDFAMDGMEEFGLFFWGLFVFLLCIMLPVAFWRCTKPDGNEDASACSKIQKYFEFSQNEAFEGILVQAAGLRNKCLLPGIGSLLIKPELPEELRLGFNLLAWLSVSGNRCGAELERLETTSVCM